jgi:phytol kinase
VIQIRKRTRNTEVGYGSDCRSYSTEYGVLSKSPPSPLRCLVDGVYLPVEGLDARSRLPFSLETASSISLQPSLLLCLLRTLFILTQRGRNTAMLFFQCRRLFLKYVVLLTLISHFAAAFACIKEPIVHVKRISSSKQHQERPCVLSSWTAFSSLHLSQDDSAFTDEESKQTTYSLVGAGATFVTSLVTAVAFAKCGVLRGPLDVATGTFGFYTDAMIVQDSLSAVFTAVMATILVKIITYANEEGIYGPKVGRKLVHTLSAPLFMLFWPIFSSSDGARFFAGVVTLTNMMRLYLAGTGGDNALAGAISRSGDKSEALEGPFIYVCIFQACIMLFWRSSMTGIIAVNTMAVGDGMADLVGRKWGQNNRWFFSKDKSIVGSAAFAASSSLCSIGLVSWLISVGCLQSTLEFTDLSLRIIGISVVCALVELIPIGNDNYTVPLCAGLLAALFLS